MQEERQVLIVGDSQLKHVKGEVLSKTKRKVTVRSVSGLRSEKLLNHIEHDTYGNVIIRVGTNDLRHNSADCIVEELDESLIYLHARNPDCQVTFSCIFKRKDSSDLNEKGQAVNRPLKERLNGSRN